MLDYSNHDPEVRLLVASVDRTPVEVLEQLSKDFNSEVRQAVASNPNTPIVILEQLGKEFPEIIISNPIFNLLLLENPDSRLVRLSLARSSNTSKEMLARLAETRDRDIVRAIAENVNTPQETLARIASEETLACELAYQYPNDIHADFQIMSSESILLAIAHNVTTSIDTLKKIKKELLQKVAGDLHTSWQILETLANDEDDRVRGEVAANPNTSAQVLEKLAGDKNYFVRLQVFANRNTSPEVLERLLSIDNYAALEQDLRKYNWSKIYWNYA